MNLQITVLLRMLHLTVGVLDRLWVVLAVDVLAVEDALLVTHLSCCCCQCRAAVKPCCCQAVLLSMSCCRDDSATEESLADTTLAVACALAKHLFDVSPGMSDLRA